MYKVFIVEDEHLIRESLRKQVLELAKEFPINYEGEATDGEMALALITDLQPDIILTDIRMPFMDGLAFSREARKQLPWAKIIFISGFDDFHYMKAAIQVQALDYLRKPVKKAELKAVLEKAIAELDRQKHSTPIAAEEVVDEVKRHHFLNGLFTGELTIEEALKQATNWSLSLVGQKFTVLLATNTFSGDLEAYSHFSEQLHFLFSGNKQLLFSSMSSRYIKFLLFSTTKEQVLESSYRVAHTLIHELEQSKDDDIAVAIGPIVDRLGEIPQAFEYARDLLASYPNLRTEKIMSFEDNFKDGELSPTHPFKRDLAQEISQLDESQIPTYINELAQEQAGLERTQMYRFFILSEMANLVKKMQPSKELAQKIGDSNQLANIARNKENYIALIHEQVEFLLKRQINPSMAKYRSVITRSLNFIDEQFNNPEISLNLVADEMNLSPSHFSTIFSQSLGQTFIEYLTAQRLHRAEELLLTTNLRLADIALAIGYNDPNYFSFIFKKHQGISPKEFRQRRTSADTSQTL